ncbi:hypothetical protein PSm6_46980 [Pseudomonas solani]|uniref:Uncharacterized protein n=1 Tax=Pseudomonas solani TaxID=2731552 RepID=A0ABM7LF72_9PSED|nr:hypothetical protein [Pseudomonas solani]EQM69621.1 hypothetical protein L682_01465 [Pseudomonas alcaligenes OT 69]MDN4147330.1 hypothetical protein [Pseudomonas tohonis]BCD88291.1 hypothetical protein PSm6_46980 [Pseudomonas solani]
MDSESGTLDRDYQRIHREATALAGTLTDLGQRASVYHHLYEDSGGRNVFPLIAAHGALWGAGYFALGMRVGTLLSAQFLFTPALRHHKLRQLHAFADAFREINRRVCVEAYTAYHLSRLHGQATGIGHYLQPRLLAALNRCHQAQALGEPLPQPVRRELFEAFFLWEQEVIVGPAVEHALATLDWPLIRQVALRPRIEFAYFASSRDMKFSDFASTRERIEKGMRAYELAEQAGLDRVEAALSRYGVLPQAFFHDSLAHFRALRQRLNLPEALPATG